MPWTTVIRFDATCIRAGRSETAMFTLTGNKFVTNSGTLKADLPYELSGVYITSIST